MLPLPAKLIASLEGADDERRQWIDGLPSMVAELQQRWGLLVGEPFQPGGQCSWVAPVTDGQGRDLVLKVGWVHEEALHEADALRVWKGDGVVHLHDDDGRGNLLLERLRPGSSGWDLPAAEQDELVASMLQRLWTSPLDDHPFRPLSDMCEQWTSREPTSALEEEGFALFRELGRSAPTQVLLHTDLHPGNILAAEREPWLAIDPKPYVGDAAYDVTQHLMSCRHFGADPRGLVRRMADLAGLDEERVRLWTWARCIIDPGARLLQVAREISP